MGDRIDIVIMFNPTGYSRHLGNTGFVDATWKLVNMNKTFLIWRQEPESILDLGIGDGRTTKEAIIPILPKNIKEYIGADISEIMLQSARETINLETFKTIQLDGTMKCLPPELLNRFHHIFSNYFFNYIHDVRQAFINVKRMLKPGGQLLFHTLDKMFTEEAYVKLDQGIWKKYDNRQSNSPFFECEDPMKEYTTLVENLGFVDCHFYKQHFVAQLAEKDFEELFTALNGRLPYIEETDRQAYVKDYVEEIKKCSRVKQIISRNGEDRLFEISGNIITGVITKPN